MQGGSGAPGPAGRAGRAGAAVGAVAGGGGSWAAGAESPPVGCAQLQCVRVTQQMQQTRVASWGDPALERRSAVPTGTGGETAMLTAAAAAAWLCLHLFQHIPPAGPPWIQQPASQPWTQRSRCGGVMRRGDCVVGGQPQECLLPDATVGQPISPPSRTRCRSMTCCGRPRPAAAAGVSGPSRTRWPKRLPLPTPTAAAHCPCRCVAV